jgi:hypothetical protein
VSWLRGKIRDVREAKQHDTFLYDFYPFGHPAYVYWFCPGPWGLGLAVDGDDISVTIGKLLVTISRTKAAP